MKIIANKELEKTINNCFEDNSDEIIYDEINYDFVINNLSFKTETYHTIIDKGLSREIFKQKTDFIIITGTTKEKQKALNWYYKRDIGFNLNNYYSIICELNLFCTLMYSDNMTETIRLIRQQAIACHNLKPINEYGLEYKGENVAYNILLSLRNVRYKRAKTIVDTLHLTTLDDLRNITSDELVKCERIDNALATHIVSELERMFFPLKK